MHPEARAAVDRAETELRRHQMSGSLAILDAGGRDVNGNVRDLFPFASRWTVVDKLDGPDVDIVADLTTWEPPCAWDVVVCCEVLEHEQHRQAVIDTCVKALRPGGALIITCATEPREPHSALDGGPLRVGEWYANVHPGELAGLADRLWWIHVETHPRGDLYVWGVKR